MNGQRVSCVGCRVQSFIKPNWSCPNCGSQVYSQVIPSRADVEHLVSEIVDAAEAVDAAWQSGRTITPASALGQRLQAACRELALAKDGVLCR